MAAVVTNLPSDSLPIATMIHMISIKLSSGNYLLWKRQIIPMLTSFELLGFIDGSKSAPPATSASTSGDLVENSAYTKWLTTDQRFLAVLFSSLSEEAMAEVVDCTTSRDAWLALEAAYSHSSTSRSNQLREELLSLRRGSLSVKDYGARFKGLCDQLSAIRKPVDESDKSHWFLRGLGVTFANFADARMSMQPIPSFSTLLHQAIQFEIMSRAMDPSDSSSSPPVAFTGSFGQNPSAGAQSSRPSNFSTGTGGRGGGHGGGGRSGG